MAKDGGPIRVVGISGSLRAGSYNTAALKAAIALAPDGMTIEAAEIGDLPLYNDDVRVAGYPPQVQRFRDQLAAADAILFVTPEYNYSIPGVLKNAIDWASRPYGKNSWAGKTVAVTGTSGGAVGTAVSQNELRMILTNLAGAVVGGQVFVTFKEDLIDAQHNVTNEATRGFLQGFLDNFAKIAGKLAA